MKTSRCHNETGPCEITIMFDRGEPGEGSCIHIQVSTWLGRPRSVYFIELSEIKYKNNPFKILSLFFPVRQKNAPFPATAIKPPRCSSIFFLFIFCQESSIYSQCLGDLLFLLVTCASVLFHNLDTHITHTLMKHTYRDLGVGTLNGIQGTKCLFSLTSGADAHLLILNPCRHWGFSGGAVLTPAVIWAVGTMLAPGSIKYVWGSVSVSTAFISVCQQTQGPVLSAELGPLGLLASCPGGQGFGFPH